MSLKVKITVKGVNIFFQAGVGGGGWEIIKSNAQDVIC